MHIFKLNRILSSKLIKGKKKEIDLAGIYRIQVVAMFKIVFLHS